MTNTSELGYAIILALAQAKTLENIPISQRHNTESGLDCLGLNQAGTAEHCLDFLLTKRPKVSTSPTVWSIFTGVGGRAWTGEPLTVLTPPDQTGLSGHR
ncbi:hypothetical protein RRG08_002945 [Elysia crispata]|uniref:Uncharacterized protein n=1 Tax=Elysia crispata TaxID=231223 RepID=A0AAE1AQ01_9GAST|nr:hypothetical protein RRG08_002945 [Elysia crispata]